MFVNIFDSEFIKRKLCLFHAIYEPLKEFLRLLVNVGKIGVQPAACEKIGVCNPAVLLQIVQVLVRVVLSQYTAPFSAIRASTVIRLARFQFLLSPIFCTS